MVNARSYVLFVLRTPTFLEKTCSFFISILDCFSSWHLVLLKWTSKIIWKFSIWRNVDHLANFRQTTQMRKISAVPMYLWQPVSLTRPGFNPEQKWALRVQSGCKNLVWVDPVQIFTNSRQISLQKFKNPEPEAQLAIIFGKPRTWSKILISNF